LGKAIGLSFVTVQVKLAGGGGTAAFKGAEAMKYGETARRSGHFDMCAQRECTARAVQALQTAVNFP
jgi:hypothetical protein